MPLYARPNRPELDPTKVPSALDIAWAAGIYEGEGTCRNCGKTKRGFMVSVTQKDPEILYRLRIWFGGSVRDNGAGAGVHTWDICGDRARIFTALTYEFLTVRRKTQVDATGCLEFLGGRSPISLSIDELKDQLLAYYEAHRGTTWRGNAKRRKEYQRDHHLAAKKQRLTVMPTGKTA
jgi:hypothetical protein